MSRLMKCEQCEALYPEDEILRAPHPFDPDDTVLGCPKCKSVDSFRPTCDEPGCTLFGTAGIPTPSGYRYLCHKHSMPYLESAR